MGGQTTKFGLHYPTLSDPADIRQIQTLAQDVDGALGTTDKAVGIRTIQSGFIDRPTGPPLGMWGVSQAWGGATTNGTNLVAPVAGVYHVSARLTVARLDQSPNWEMLQAAVYDNLGTMICRLQTLVPWIDWNLNTFTYEFSDRCALAAGGHVLVGCIYNGRVLAGAPQPLTGFSMHRVGSL